MLKTASLIGLVLYFVILLLVVLKEKKNSDVEDYFFAGRSLPFWALSITFIASWWGGGSALSTADLAFADGMGAFWYYGVPVLVATLLMGLGARAIRSVGYLTQGAMMEARYSRPVARLLALMILFFMLFSAASQMVAVGDFFGTFLGMGYEGGVLAGTLIVLVYPCSGAFAAWCLRTSSSSCCCSCPPWPSSWWPCRNAAAWAPSRRRRPAAAGRNS